MSESNNNNNGRRRRRRNRKKRNKKDNPQSTKPKQKQMCRYFNSPRGCRFGDKCRFVHEESTKGEESWWRKCPEPTQKDRDWINRASRPKTKGRDFLQLAEIGGDFRRQLIQCLSVPRRIRLQMQTEAALISNIVRSYVPHVEVYCSVSLDPLLKEAYDFALLSMATCPLTSNVYIGGTNTPVFRIDPTKDEPELEWLCGPSWEENAVTAPSPHTITDIFVLKTGVVLYTLGNKGVDNRQTQARGVYRKDDSGLKRLTLIDRHTLAEVHECFWSIYVNEDTNVYYLISGESLYVCHPGHHGDPDKLLVRRSLDLSQAARSNPNVPERLRQIVPFAGTNYIGISSFSKLIIVHTETLEFSTFALNLSILSYCYMPKHGGSLIMHSPKHVRVVGLDTILRCVKEKGDLRQAIIQESHKIYTKSVVMDMPLLGYDGLNQQVVTDTDSRVITWLDVY